MKSNVINGLEETSVRGAKRRAACRSNGLAAAADQVRQIGNERLLRHVELAAEVIPERNGVLGTGLCETEKSIAAIASGQAVGSGADFAVDHLAADVVLRAIGVQR